MTEFLTVRTTGSKQACWLEISLKIRTIFLPLELNLTEIFNLKSQKNFGDLEK